MGEGDERSGNGGEKRVHRGIYFLLQRKTPDDYLLFPLHFLYFFHIMVLSDRISGNLGQMTTNR